MQAAQISHISAADAVPLSTAVDVYVRADSRTQIIVIIIVINKINYVFFNNNNTNNNVENACSSGDSGGAR